MTFSCSKLFDPEMPIVQERPWLRRYAAVTLGVALVTALFGTLTTSMKAGMAFRDWPTSDGQFMVTYPWFQDFARDWDRFLEHGHRLSGMLIGMFAIGLVVLVYRYECRRSARFAAVTVLLGIIGQGVLGGVRVLRESFDLAQVHGAFAAVVFSILAVLITMLGRHWIGAASDNQGADVEHLRPFALLCVLALGFQYFLGGLIRHHGTGLHEHLAMGGVSLVLLLVNAWLAWGSGVHWIRRGGVWLAVVVAVQVLLGLAAWVLKFGHAATGYVAVADSIEQVIVRTAHTLVGILTFMVSIIYTTRVFRVYAVTQVTTAPVSSSTSSSTTSQSMAGGAA